jgi:hypothetical protein
MDRQIFSHLRYSLLSSVNSRLFLRYIKIYVIKHISHIIMWHNSKTTMNMKLKFGKILSIHKRKHFFIKRFKKQNQIKYSSW